MAVILRWYTTIRTIIVYLRNKIFPTSGRHNLRPYIASLGAKRQFLFAKKTKKERGGTRGESLQTQSSPEKTILLAMFIN